MVEFASAYRDVGLFLSLGLQFDEHKKYKLYYFVISGVKK